MTVNQDPDELYQAQHADQTSPDRETPLQIMEGTESQNRMPVVDRIALLYLVRLHATPILLKKQARYLSLVILAKTIRASTTRKKNFVSVSGKSSNFG